MTLILPPIKLLGKNSYNTLVEKYNLPVIISTHPRLQKNLNLIKKKFHTKIKFIKAFGFNDYIKLQLHAKAVLSDSGTITEEASILNFPALNLREVHERPEGMEEASVMMVGLEIERVKQGLKILEKYSHSKDLRMFTVKDYYVKNVSDKIVRIIHSYTDYVNRVVWNK